MLCSRLFHNRLVWRSFGIESSLHSITLPLSHVFFFLLYQHQPCRSPRFLYTLKGSNIDEVKSNITYIVWILSDEATSRLLREINQLEDSGHLSSEKALRQRLGLSINPYLTLIAHEAERSSSTEILTFTGDSYITLIQMTELWMIYNNLTLSAHKLAGNWSYATSSRLMQLLRSHPTAQSTPSAPRVQKRTLSTSLDHQELLRFDQNDLDSEEVHNYIEGIADNPRSKKQKRSHHPNLYEYNDNTTANSAGLAMGLFCAQQHVLPESPQTMSMALVLLAQTVTILRALNAELRSQKMRDKLTFVQWIKIRLLPQSSASRKGLKFATIVARWCSDHLAVLK